MMLDNRIIELKELLKEAKSIGLNVDEQLSQIKNAIENINEPIIRLVLLGAFSDGKTTTIAGVLGKEEANMKIDIEESSDELTFYHIPALGREFEIVDTPGLFGTKEKAINGKTIRYSDITRDYISQAHVLIYVTDAVNSLKDSHSGILKTILRDFNKLPNTIFVINKMDEAGVVMSDNEDFHNNVRIKRETFIERLDNIIHLSNEEKNNLKISCISANPSGKGLSFWFAHPDKYEQRSRISDLKKNINGVISSINKESVKDNVRFSVINDLVLQIIRLIKLYQKNSKSPFEQIKEQEENIENKLAVLRRDALANKRSLQEALVSYQMEIELELDNATMISFEAVINKYIGENGERLDRGINQLFSEFSERNNTDFKNSKISFEFEKMNVVAEQTMKWGARVLKNTKVTSNGVKAIRDVVASGFKFKPWGAVKLATKATKFLGALSLAIDGILWFKKRKEEKKFEDARNKIKKEVISYFSQSEKYLNSEEEYFKNFAPGILIVEGKLKDCKKILAEMQNNVQNVYEFKNKLEAWYGMDIQDVEYEEILY